MLKNNAEEGVRTLVGTKPIGFQMRSIFHKEEISRDVLEDEKRFTLEVILPLLRNMEFIDIKYNHGVREYGKDARRVSYGGKIVGL